MKTDYVFIFAACAGYGGGIALAARAVRSRANGDWPGAALWLILATGLLIQGLSPHLQQASNGFVVPFSLFAHYKKLDPTTLEARDRRMQILAAVITAFGAVGLAYHYRNLLARARGPPAEPMSHLKHQLLRAVRRTIAGPSTLGSVGLSKVFTPDA